MLKILCLEYDTVFLSYWLSYIFVLFYIWIIFQKCIIGPLNPLIKLIYQFGLINKSAFIMAEDWKHVRK